MRPFLALMGKQIHEAKWSLFLSAAVLFGLGWLFVWVTSLNEAEIVRRLGDDSEQGRIQLMRMMGVNEEASSLSLIMVSWSHPFILLLISIWAIGRGSAAVAAEVERGTMDLLLSRPVSRSAYLASGVIVSLIGLVVLAGALMTGASIAVHYNVLRERPEPWAMFLPAVNLAALGLPIYGYTLLAGALDHVRWRATLIGSVLTLIGFVALVISLIPILQTMSWEPWVERISIFKAYNPIQAVNGGDTYQLHLAILTGIGAGFIALAFAAFAVRDLPANG
jgi:beta-exotoxin I transport system permease protein